MRRSRYARPQPELHGLYASKVGNFSQAQRKTFLIGMMKVNFLKWLESSVHAFALTMERTIGKIEALSTGCKPSNPPCCRRWRNRCRRAAISSW